MNPHEDLTALAFKKALPLLVAFVAFVGGCCFTILAPVETLDRASAAGYSAFGVLGTIGMVALFIRLRHFPPTWRLYTMRRNLVMFLLCLCWGFGAISGFIVFYVIPRQVAS
jgi:hypothetical protein